MRRSLPLSTAMGGRRAFRLVAWRFFLAGSVAAEAAFRPYHAPSVETDDDQEAFDAAHGVVAARGKVADLPTAITVSGLREPGANGRYEQTVPATIWNGRPAYYNSASGRWVYSSGSSSARRIDRTVHGGEEALTYSYAGGSSLLGKWPVGRGQPTPVVAADR